MALDRAIQVLRLSLTVLLAFFGLGLASLSSDLVHLVFLELLCAGDRNKLIVIPAFKEQSIVEEMNIHTDTVQCGEHRDMYNRP